MSTAKESVALSSVFASAGMAIMKLVVGVLTGSMGILSEAAHSLLDLGAAILTFFAVKIGDKPADDTHPYGHGKVESVSALIETGLLFLTSAWIVYEAISRLWTHDTHVEANWYAFAVILVSIIIDISRSRALMKEAERSNSQALEADALHFSSDIWSSAVVLLGLFMVKFFNIDGADTWAALVVAVFVMVAGYRLGKRTIGVLIDTAPEGIADIVRETVRNVADVMSVENVWVRPLGASIHIDVEIGVSRLLAVSKVDEIASEVKARLRSRISNAEVVVRTKSLQLTNETILEVVQGVASKHALSTHNIIVENLGEKKIISYDLEIPGNVTLGEAHAITTKLENILVEELGPNIEVVTHIDPMFTEEAVSGPVHAEEAADIERMITMIVRRYNHIHSPHDIHTRKVKGKYLTTLHCYADAEALLETVHREADLLKEAVLDAIVGMQRVVVHVEPEEHATV